MTDLTDDEHAYLAAVFDAARQGDTTVVARALERGVPANLTNATGDSLLILAAYNEQVDTVRFLLAHGADPDRVNDQGQTALAAAAFRRCGDGVVALLDAGPDPRHGPRSAQQVVAFFGLDDMAELLDREPAPDPDGGSADLTS